MQRGSWLAALLAPATVIVMLVLANSAVHADHVDRGATTRRLDQRASQAFVADQAPARGPVAMSRSELSVRDLRDAVPANPAIPTLHVNSLRSVSADHP